MERPPDLCTHTISDPRSSGARPGASVFMLPGHAPREAGAGGPGDRRASPGGRPLQGTLEEIAFPNMTVEYAFYH